MATRKWKDEYYVKVHQLAKQGESDQQIAKALGITPATLNSWKKKKPALMEALKSARSAERTAPGRQAGGDVEKFHEYVFNRLAPHLKDLWNEIMAIEDADLGVDRVEALLANRGKTARQHLFIYAWTSSGFMLSTALRRVNVSRSMFDKWCRSDPNFAEMVDEIHWHKDNYFEEALINLVRGGDTAATIHVAKSRLADRGYNPTQQVDVQGKVEHTTIDVDSLELPLESRLAILDAVRRDSRVIEGETA